MENGGRFVQVRMKGAPADVVADVLRRLMPVAVDCGAVLVVDDHVELAHLCHGVHLGRNDMPVAQARDLLGADKLIGVTVNDTTDLDRLEGCSFDSIGMGPWRFTTTKEALAPCLGAVGMARLVALARARGFNQPIYAIGGMRVDDVPAVLRAGATSVAVSGAITGAGDMAAACRGFVEALS